MNKLDIRSVLIGVLCTALVFVLIGAKSQNENLGHIVVNSIRVLNENGNPVAGLWAEENGGGLGIYNTDGNLVAGLTANEHGGDIDVINADGKMVASLVAHENGGLMSIYNDDGNPAVGISGTEHGGIALYDRYGDIGWSESGKQ